jgi:hypothetical protein
MEERSMDQEECVRWLGKATLDCWGDLPQETEKLLFERAVTEAGPELRNPLAVSLHDHHPRTENKPSVIV